MSERRRDEDDGAGSEQGSERDQLEVLAELVSLTRRQTEHLESARGSADLDTCLLDKIGRIVCITANETHRNSTLLAEIAASLSALLTMYRGAHPDQAVLLDRWSKIEADVAACCAEDSPPPDEICVYQPCEPDGGVRRGDGYSAKSRGYIEPEQVDEHRHERWEIRPHALNEEDEHLPTIQRGPFVGQLVPSTPTPGPLDFRSGGGPTPPGGQAPVTFRTFSTSGVSTNVWPPDMSGAKSGDVVVMSGNLWLKLSVDAGKTFTDVNFTDVFAAETTYGGWAGDQVIHYVPQIDCFVLYGSRARARKARRTRARVWSRSRWPAPRT